MLLDFNLAVGWPPPARGAGAGTGGGDRPGDAGGTLAYMAPERLLAIAGPGPGPAPRPTAADRHRGDVYALGVVLLELLTGRAPAPPGPRGRAASPAGLAAAYAAARLKGAASLIREAGAPVPPGLRSILERCLAPDPADRYRRAGELAEDLDGWRNDRPLAFAPEPALRTGLVRWARRQRRALVAGTLGLAVSAGATALLWRAAEAERPVASASEFIDGDEFRARFTLADPEVKLGVSAEVAKRRLERYGVLGPGRRGDWRQRDEFRRLPAAEREELEAWLTEQGLRFAHALGERPDSPGDWQRALALLEEVAATTPLRALRDECQKLRGQLGLPEPHGAPTPAPGGRPPGWIDDYLAGAGAELTGRYGDALDAYRAVLKRRGRSLLVNYRTAAVAFTFASTLKDDRTAADRLKGYQTAADCLKVCIAQRPDSAALRVAYAASLYQLQRDGEASEQYDRAQGLDPDFAETYLSRLYVRLRLGQFDGYIRDVDRYDVVKGLRPGPRAGLPLLDLARASRATGPDATPPRRPADPNEISKRIGLANLLDSAGQRELAADEYGRILEADPDEIKAHMGRALELTKLRRSGDDREYTLVTEHPKVSSLLDEYPDAVYAFQRAASARIKQGNTDEALRTARRGLEHAERRRAVLSRTSPDLVSEMHFTLAVACVSAGPNDPRLREEARAHLSTASGLAPNYIRGRLPKFPALGALLAEPDPPLGPDF
jgi:tetratricopeptide (TPR) repeat protein